MQAVRHIYQAEYLKEVKAARQEGREVAPFEQLIIKVNHHIYKDQAFAKKVHGAIAQSLAHVEIAQLLALKQSLQAGEEELDEEYPPMKEGKQEEELPKEREKTRTFSQQDRVNLHNIEQELAEQYPNLPKSERKELALEIYQLEQEWQHHPESRPGIQLAYSGGMNSDVPLVTMPTEREQAMRLVMNSYNKETNPILSATGEESMGMLDKLGRGVDEAVEWGLQTTAAWLEHKVDAALKKVKETGSTRALEAVLATMQGVSYGVSAAEGAAVGAVGGPWGAALGAVGGIGKQYSVDSVSEEAIKFGASNLHKKYPSITERQAEIMALTTLVGAGSVKGAKDYLLKSANKLKLVDKIHDTSHNVMDSPFHKPHEGSGSLLGHETISSHARELIVENPYIAKKYVAEIEDVTKLAVDAKQVNLLKNALKEREFVKLDQANQTIHRKEFKNNVAKLRQEWEINTGQKWPVYEVEVLNNGIKEIKVKKYDAHHIIQVDHGGPNEWWNIHPAHGLTEHPKIHGTGSIANQIFKPKQDKK